VSLCCLLWPPIDPVFSSEISVILFVVFFLQTICLCVCRQAILSSMPLRSVIGSTPLASQSLAIGDYCISSACIIRLGIERHP